MGVVVAVQLVVSVVAHPGTSAALPSGVPAGDGQALSGVTVGSGDLAIGDGVSQWGSGEPAAVILPGGLADGGSRFAPGDREPARSEHPYRRCCRQGAFVWDTYRWVSGLLGLVSAGGACGS